MKKFTTFSNFLDDQDLWLSNSSHALFSTLLPFSDNMISQLSSVRLPPQRRISRSFSTLIVEPKVLVCTRRFLDFIRKLRTNAFVRLISAINSTKFEEIASKVAGFICPGLLIKRK